MPEGGMPPSVTNSTGGNKKNKKKDKSNVQQVQPQPQKPPSPETSQYSDNDKPEEPTRIIVDPVKDELDDVPLIDASPPIAPPRHCKSSPASAAPAAHSPSIPTSTGKTVREKTPVIAYIKGQMVKATSVPQSSFVNSMAEFVQENIQQSASPIIQPEKIDWVQFYSIDKGCDKKVDVILMGLTRGFQVWVKHDNGDFEEVMSERQGPIKSFTFISPVDRNTGLKGDRSPMIAFVDAFSHVPDRQFSTVSVVDLLSKKVNRLPSASDSFEEAVTGLSSSNRYLIVALTSRIIVYETAKLTKVASFRIATPPEGSSGVFAINHGLLAYADDNLNGDKQSCGGLEPGPEEPATYTSQTLSMFKAISSTVKNLGESVTGAGAAKGKDMPQGVLTVVNLDEQKENNVLAHVVAHYEALAHIAWSPDGRLLLTADSNGCTYHVFLFMPHPTSPSLSTVQHVYRLHRGNTAAKVYCTSFTVDCRWLAVSTNHGTTHIFAINPYGGKPTVATHGDDFTNKESRFLRSAGLTESNENLTFSARSRTHSGQMQVNKDHPALKQRILAKCAGNPRIGPFNPPVLLTAVKKIRDSRFSTDNLSAWAADLNPVALGNKRSRTVELPRTAIMFSNRHLATRGAFALLIARADNGIFEYELKPRPNNLENPEKPPELEVVSSSMWALQRTKNNPDIPPPLQAGSPLVTFEKAREQPAKTPEDWIPQLEIGTYSVPSRRLWQGPQFSFFQYSEDATEVITPSDSRSSVASIKCIPIVMGDRAVDRDDSIGEATRIECGSWVSQNSLTMMGPGGDDGELSLKIADAMKEIHIDRGLRQNSSMEDFASFSPRGDARSNSGDDELLHFDDI